MPEAISHYLVLGVDRDASQQEIKEAFTRVSTQTAVQLGGGGMGGQRSARIEEAYAVLSDPHRRAKYDETLERGES